MNAYQLEYVCGLNSDTLEYAYLPLTKGKVADLGQDESLVVTFRQKAGIPVSSKGRITNEVFMLNNPSEKAVKLAYEFLPKIEISKNQIVSPSSVKIEKISKDFANKKAEVFKSPIGDKGQAAISGLTPATPADSQPATSQTAQLPENATVSATTTPQRTTTVAPTTRTTATPAVQPTIGTGFSVDGGSSGGFGGGGY